MSLWQWVMTITSLTYSIRQFTLTNDKEDVLKYALTRYKDINNRLYSDEYGLTLLTYACKLSNVKLARILLEHGIDVNGYQSPYDTYKVYPIMEAIANNNIELVKLLLEYHADLNIKDSNGNTPLALAKEIGAKEVEDLLLMDGTTKK